jgi:hemolysin III
LVGDTSTESTTVKPYSRGWIHAGMFPLVIAASVVLIAAARSTPLKAACAVFAASAILLFGVSGVYHIGRWGPTWTGVLRRFDHSNIALIIAGTYTPLAVGLLTGNQRTLLLCLIWGGALGAILIRVLWLNAPRWSYVPIYIALGWTALGFLPQFWHSGGPAVVWELLGGGVAYTVGAIVYALKRPNPWPRHFGFHEIFHSLTVVGFVSHFVAVATVSWN